MEYIREDQILLDEELCDESAGEDKYLKAVKLFRDNIKLTTYVLNKFQAPLDPAIDIEDLQQEAYIALWRACLGFDETRGYNFSTYAIPYIKGSLTTKLRTSGSIKFSRVAIDIRSEILARGFTMPLSREEKDILIATGKFSEYDVEKYIDYLVISYNEPAGEDSTILDTLSEDCSDLLVVQREEDLLSLIDTLLSYTSPVHRDLVEEWLYSIALGDNMRQQTLSVKYGLHQTYISRILRGYMTEWNKHKSEILG